MKDVIPAYSSTQGCLTNFRNRSFLVKCSDFVAKTDYELSRREAEEALSL